MTSSSVVTLRADEPYPLFAINQMIALFDSVIVLEYESPDRDAPPVQSDQGDVVVVSGTPTPGTPFEGHANAIGIWWGDEWMFTDEVATKYGLILYDKNPATPSNERLKFWDFPGQFYNALQTNENFTPPRSDYGSVTVANAQDLQTRINDYIQKCKDAKLIL